MSLQPRPRVVATLLVIAVVVAVGAGLLLVGPPSEERARRRDTRRIQDLTRIAFRVDQHWTKLSVMPLSFDDLLRADIGDFTAADPFTRQPYEYRRTDSFRYELCATFDSEASNPTQLNYNATWPHGVGRVCFPRVAGKHQLTTRRVLHEPFFPSTT